MSKLNRKKLQKMILQEFKMIGMTEMHPMGKIGTFSQGCSKDKNGNQDKYDFTGVMDGIGNMEEDALLPMHTSDATPSMGSASTGTVSREDCCAAVMSMIECCSCPATKDALAECCQDILSGVYDNNQ